MILEGKRTLGKKDMLRAIGLIAITITPETKLTKKITPRASLESQLENSTPKQSTSHPANLWLALGLNILRESLYKMAASINLGAIEAHMFV